jgi:predicted Zn-dependent peptidase
MLSRLDHVTEAELQREKNVVLAERHQRYDNAPGGAAAEAIMGALFPEGHPYHDAGAGSARSIGEITLADAQAFARVRYAPNNATLVIAGSFEPRVAEGLVDRRFGDMPRVDLPPALTAPPVTLDHERRIELAADVGTDMLLVVWPLPRAGSDALPPASVLSEYLELLPETSRIERRRVWVAEQRLASMLIVSMALSFDTPPARVLERLDRHLSEVASENRDLVAQQFAQARTRASSSVYFGLDRLDARAAALGWGVRLFGDLEETEKRVPALLAVTAEDAQDVVRTFLPPEGRVIVTIHATPGATRRGEIMP